MSAVLKATVGAAAIGLCCLMLAGAVAQRTTNRNPPGEIKPAQAQSDVANPFGRPDQNATGRTDQATAPRGEVTQPGVTTGRQPYTANYRGAPAGTRPSQEVETYLANCLLKHNQGEVELSQFAQQQTQNPAVKQFAAQLEKDHQQVVQKLQQLTGTPAAGTRNPNPELGANAATGTDNTTVGATGGRPDSNTFDPARPISGTEATAATAPNRGAPSTIGANAPAMPGNSALSQLAAIEQKINDRCMQAFREELQQKSGNEFDECYVGSQLGGHMHMLAALEVLSQDSQGQLKQIAEEARPTVQKHLDDAKQLIAQLKGGSQNSPTAKRSTTSTERQ